MNPRRSWLRRVGLVVSGALATTAPVLLADETMDGSESSGQHALQAARAWSDLLPGQASPAIPSPGEHESAIVVLSHPPLARVGESERASAASAIAAEQATFLQELTATGGQQTFAYRALVNGVGVRVPTGRLASLANLPGVVAVYPVSYLVPAQVGATTPQPLPPSAAAAASAPTTPSRAPQTIALIDAGIHPEHPALGGGIGLDRLIIGGEDLVNGNQGPQAPAESRVAEAHGTQMAALVLGSSALTGFAPDRTPRLRAYRVVADEVVDGRTQSLARTDRVLAAMDRAADPDNNGDLSDHSSVILLGMAGSGGSGGVSPLEQASRSADELGVVVVAPAGNSGPGTLTGMGTVGAPATSPSVLTVGGLAAPTTPRTATVRLSSGPAESTFKNVPLLGPAPPDDDHRVVVLASGDGVVTGVDVRDYTDANGQSRVQGAVVVVGRGGGTLQQKAQAAAQAGAVAVAVWDHSGNGMFPGVHADGELALPMIGLGAAQGRLLMQRADLTLSIDPNPVRATSDAVAAFSAQGPAPNGAAVPTVVAPAVDVATAYPGPGAEALSVKMSGTSAAAATVAAMVVRVREDHPQLTPADVRSLFVQSADPVAGASLTVQGAGVARIPQLRPVTIEPGLVGARQVDGAATTLTVTLHEIEGTGRQVRLGVTDAFGVPVVQPGSPVDLPAGGRSQATVTIPAGAGDFAGILHVVAPDNRVLATAPILVSGAPRRAVRLSSPRITTDGKVTRIAVAVRGPVGGLSGVHDLTLTLLPAPRATPIALSNPRVVSEWPIGNYRFELGTRAADGSRIPPGIYRVRVDAVGPDGAALRVTSAGFRVTR